MIYIIRHILIKIIILLLVFSTFIFSQSKSRRAILYHQSTGLNYFGVNICDGIASTDIARQVPVYNDNHGLVDTISFTRRGYPIMPDPGASSWNNIHHIFDGDASFSNTWNQLRLDTANYGIIHIKTCFSWEAGWQSWTPVYSDVEIESNRETYHNIWTSKYHIRHIVARMGEMNTVKWILWTMPPSSQSQNDQNSAWDLQLATWMKDTLANGLDPNFGSNFPSNVYIFDLFRLTADSKGELPLVFSCASNNSHPNKDAVATFAPTIVEETFNWVLSLKVSKYIIHPYPRKASMVWTPTCGWDMARYDIVMGSHYDTAAVRRAREKFHADSTYFLVTRDYNQGGIFADAYYWINVPLYFAIYDSAGNALGSPEHRLANWSVFSDTDATGRKNWQFQADSVYEFFDWDLWDGIHSDGFHHSILPPNNQIVDLDRNGYSDYNEPSKGATIPERLAWIENHWHWGWNNFANRLRQNWINGGYTNKIISMWTMGSYQWQYSSIIDTCGVKQFNGEEWENVWNSLESNNISASNTFADWFQKYTAWKNNAGQSPSWHVITVGMNGAPGRPSSLGERDWWYARFWIAWGSLTDAYICFHHTYNDGVDHESALYYDEFDIPLGHPTTEAVILPNGAWVRFFDNGAIIFHPGSSAQITVTLSQISSLSGYNGPYYKVVNGQDTSRHGGLFDEVVLTPHRVDTYWAGDALFLLKWQDTIVSPIIVDNAYFPTSPGSNPAVLTGNYYYDVLASGQDRGTGAVYVNPTFTNVMHWNSGDNAIFTLQQVGRQHYAFASIQASAWASYTPTINRAGKYILYEWHGWRGSSENYANEATNARFEIQHAEGTTIAYINQRINAGEWNMIDTFYYTPTGNKTTTISNAGADGDVIFDALMWEYIEGRDEEQPSPPSQKKYLLIKGN